MLKTIITTIILFLSTLSSEVLSDGLTFRGLVEKDGIYYLKSTDSPYTGSIHETVNIPTKPLKKDANNQSQKNFELYELKGHFFNGIKTGVWETYSGEGLLFAKECYKGGQLDGPLEAYHDNGKLRAKGDYKDGKLDGPLEAYHDNGKLKSKGKKRNGKKEGVWEYYNKDGSKKAIETYKDDELIE